MSKMYESCPECGESDWLSVRLTNSRQNQQACAWCDWCGEAFEPPVRPIVNKVRYYPARGIGSGWHFETQDKYGQPRMASRAYRSRGMALKELKRELARTAGRVGSPYTAILFPPSVDVYTEIFTLESGNEVVS